MQSTEIQVFNPSDFPNSIVEMRERLGTSQNFKIEGFSHIFSARVLDHIEQVRDLTQDLTIIHKKKSYRVSSKLLVRVSQFFARLNQAQRSLINMETISLSDEISSLGLQALINYAQGIAIDLNSVSERRFYRIIDTANKLDVIDLLEAGAAVVTRKGKTLSVDELIEFSKQINKVTQYYNSILGTLFSPLVQHMMIRWTQYSFDTKESDFFQSVIKYLQETQFPLSLTFSQIHPSKDLFEILSKLRLRELDLQNCTEPVDLTSHSRLHRFRGSSVTDFSQFTLLTGLSLLRMPTALPPNLESFYLREGMITAAMLTGVPKLRDLSLGEFIDVGQLSKLRGLNCLKSLKLSSAESLSKEVLEEIASYQPGQITFKEVFISPNVKNYPPINSLVNARLIKCDDDTFNWVISSTNLAKLRLLPNINLSESMLKALPQTLVELTLEANRASARVLANILHLSNLKSLTLMDFSWRDVGLQILNGLPGLTNLSISVPGDFFSGDISFLSLMHGLTSFSVETGKTWPATVEQLNIITQLPLTHLKIKPDENLVNSGAIQQLSKMTSLKELNLVGTNKLSEIDFVASLTDLTILNLEGCRWVTPVSLSHVLQLPKLQILNTSVNLEPEQIASFFRQMPSLARLTTDQSSFE